MSGDGKEGAGSPGGLLGFLVLTHCRTAAQLATLRRCVQEIRKHHPEAPIVVLDDASPLPMPVEFAGDARLTTARTAHPGSAEIAPFEYFLTHKFCDRMV